jgi:hypothetical protein
MKCGRCGHYIGTTPCLSCSLSDEFNGSMTTPTPDIVQRLRDWKFELREPEGEHLCRDLASCFTEAATTIETLREAVRVRDEAIRVLGEEVATARGVTEVCSDPELKCCDDCNYGQAKNATDANPIARDACEAAKGTD